MAEQPGTVSEVSSSSVTVKSSDGFTRSYALGSDVVVSNLQQRRQQAGGTGTQLSVADIVAGGTVRIVAAKDSSGYTATSVMVVAATRHRASPTDSAGADLRPGRVELRMLTPWTASPGTPPNARFGRPAMQ